ncbi:MAG: hypothetical protein AAGD32_07260 [Planctomycetota bacterium]
MRLSRVLAVGFVSSLGLITAASAAPTTFVADDGRGSINTGPGAFESVDVVWGNYFTTDTPTRIASISVAFGRIAEDESVTVFVLNDPDNDGDPTNGVVTGTGVGLVTTTNANNADEFDTFVDYDITGGPEGTSLGFVEGGFFVGVLVNDLDALNPRPGQNGLRDAPARRDDDTADGAGWFFFGGGNETDLNDLAALPVGINVGDPAVFGGLAGNNLVRAVSVPEPAVMAWVGFVLAAFRRRR